MDKKYIEVSTRQIDFDPITEENFFQSTDDMAFMAQDAEQIASHPLSNIYTSNLRWALTSFNLFEFHTNFSITEQTLKTIEETVGVESLQQFTKYRGVVSVGKLFDDVLVREDIRKKITETFQDQNRKIEPFLNPKEDPPAEKQTEEES